MKILIVNGEQVKTRAENLSELCLELGFADQKIATARNENFVPARKREEVRLVEGDRIEILAPRQGG